MKVSVIIPVHNRESLVGSAIASLLRQSADADIDIVVVDDGSTDATNQVVRTVAEEFPAVRLIGAGRSGVAAARNIGIDNIHPDAGLVTFLDSDDISISGRFALEMQAFVGRPGLAMTYSCMTLVDEIDDAAGQPAPGAKTCTLRGVSLTTALFRRHTIEKIGRFREDLRQAEDLDYLLRFFESGMEYELLDNAAILYRRHPGNTTRNRDEARKYVMKALLEAAGRRRRGEVVAPIPKFFDVSQLYETQHEALR